MAMNVQPRGNSFQLRVTHKLLPKAFFHTFPDEDEARAYGNQLEAVLDRGIIPQELLASSRAPASPLLIEVIRQYETDPNMRVAVSDRELLDLLVKEAPGMRMAGITFQWANELINGYKKRKLAPGTIRKRIGALARVIDWHLRQTAKDGQQPLANVLKMLPKGYSQYADGSVKDVKRNARFAPGDEARILDAIRGVKRDDRERAWGPDPEFELFFQLIVNTGLRLSEAYKLRINQLDTVRGVLHVDGSKGHHGVIKPRTVPLKKFLRVALQDFIHGRQGRVFSFWLGTPEDLKRCTSRLSNRFQTLFSYAGVPEFTEHDLRHEACCRWVTLQGDRGWLFNEVEIAKIMGWESTDMMIRYASLRGEDLADRLG